MTTMRTLASALLAIMIAAGPALACSPTELVAKQKAYSDAVKTAFARDPAGDDARKARALALIARYGEVAKSAGPSGNAIDLMCRENDELAAIYR
jgi:hypothetical protein